MLMCFIPIHLERSMLTLHVLSLIFYPCCCYFMHILTTMQMLHLLHGRVQIFLWVSGKWSKRTNWSSSSFVWNRMRLWRGNFFVTNNKKNCQMGWQVGECDTLWTASVIYISKFKSGISSMYQDYQDTNKGDKRKESMWILHLVILQLFHPKFLKIKAQNFFTTIIPLLFIRSPPTNSKTIQISLKNFPIMIGCGWEEC